MEKLYAYVQIRKFISFAMIIGALFILSSSKMADFQAVKRPYTLDAYYFNGVKKGFDGELDISRIYEFNKKDFYKLIIGSIPKHLQDKLRPYLSPAILLSQNYQVDPFWVLAVMWVESHFNPKAKSIVSALGLMQIMPQTAHYLLEIMGRPTEPNIVYKLIEDTDINIEMGVFYLGRLLRSFDGNYKLATIAYNHGPNRVIFRLKNQLPVGVSNAYLNKVTRAYKRISNRYKIAINDNPPRWKETFVAISRRSKISVENINWDKRIYSSNVYLASNNFIYGNRKAIKGQWTRLLL